MKEETREIINDIKDALRTTMNSVRYRRAVNFLDSLPEIESHLCHGGYIQDRNGTPCCHGDNVKFLLDDCIDEEYLEMFGQLAWQFKRGQFFILANSGDYELDRLKWFEKVEK